MKKIIKYIKNLLPNTNQGYVNVFFGSNKLYISTSFTPSQVWISLEHSKTIIPNNYLKDYFDIEIVENGFILIYSVENAFRKIKWIAIQ